jgi:tyrosine-protein kinase Etk/Wzc
MTPTDVAPRAVPPPSVPGPFTPATRRAEEGPSGMELAQMLLGGRWVLAGFVALALALAGAYLLVATPRWRGEGLLRVEDRHDAGADPIATAIDAPAAKAEIELLRSRTLVAAAVEQLGLDVTAAPRRVPVLGTAWARLAGSGLARPPPWLSRYAWGGERISVARLEVPEALLDTPLVLVAGEGKRFRLSGPDGLVVEGQVGALAEGRDGEGRPVRIAVKELAARPGTEFTVRKRRTSDVVEELQLQLTVEERAKDSGIVSVRLEGTDRAQLAATLRLLVDDYLRENRERTAARVGRTAALLDDRLPVLRGDVEKAENALEAWKRKNGWVDVGTETRAILERSISADRKIAELEARRDELSRHYADKYPAIAELTNQIDALRVQQKLFEARLRSLPTSELQAARLERDVHAMTAVYVSALEKAQQYRVAAAATVGTASLVDAPVVPEKPAAPNAPLTLALSLLLGLAGGALAVVIRGHLGGTGDAVEVETATGLPVLGALPHGSTEASLARVIRRRLTGGRPAALHAVAPGDSAVEDLRALRTNLAAALRAAKSNVVVVGGPAPGVGKSFVCVNLALLLAASGRKVLLVDADLRRGRLHREFGLDPRPGLSDVLAGTAGLDEAIRPSGTDGIDVLATGERPDDPAALLERSRVAEVLAEAGKRCDVVLVDTAAVLAVTDPVLVARHAGLSLLVLRAGEHPVDEIALAVKRLRQGGARVDGAILNDLRSSRHARYRYEYRGRARA